MTATLQAMRMKSLSPAGKKDPLLLTMKNFPKKHVIQMKELERYQKTLDKRLSQPKFKQIKIKTKKKGLPINLRGSHS